MSSYPARHLLILHSDIIYFQDHLIKEIVILDCPVMTRISTSYGATKTISSMNCKRLGVGTFCIYLYAQLFLRCMLRLLSAYNLHGFWLRRTVLAKARSVIPICCTILTIYSYIILNNLSPPFYYGFFPSHFFLLVRAHSPHVHTFNVHAVIVARRPVSGPPTTRVLKWIFCTFLVDRFFYSG